MIKEKPKYEVVKTCATCAHKMGEKCMLSGFYCTTERQVPTECGNDFKGWKSNKRIPIPEKNQTCEFFKGVILGSILVVILTVILTQLDR